MKGSPEPSNSTTEYGTEGDPYDDDAELEDEDEDFVKDDDSDGESGEAHPLDALSSENQHLYPVMRPGSATRQRRLSAQRRQHMLKHNMNHAYAPSPGSAYLSQGVFVQNRSTRKGGATSKLRRSASATAVRRNKSAEVSANLYEIYGGSIGNNGSLSSRRRENDKREALLYSRDEEEADPYNTDMILERHRANKNLPRSAGPKTRKVGLARSNSMDRSPRKNNRRRISFR